jgi:hypothetical protein
MSIEKRIDELIKINEEIASTKNLRISQEFLTAYIKNNRLIAELVEQLKIVKEGKLDI